MTLSDEIAKLHELHRNGALTDEEFARAKERLIGAAHRPDIKGDCSCIYSRTVVIGKPAMLALCGDGRINKRNLALQSQKNMNHLANPG